MPKITIKETENSTFASIDAVENVVLVPLLVRKFEGDTELQVEKFTSIETFRNRFIGKPFGTYKNEKGEIVALDDEVIAGKVADILNDGVYDTIAADHGLDSEGKVPDDVIKTYIGDGFGSASHKDKSYAMICDLLNSGLSVIVKPVYAG